jgi:hypothetical protein
MTYSPFKRPTTSAFGDNVYVNLDPQVQLNAVYGNLDGVEQFTAEGGTIANVSGMFKLSNTTTVGSYAVIRSRRAAQYKPGQGIIMRVSAIFDDSNAVANSLQQVGIGTAQNGFFFGYDGTSFGIKHSRNGLFEIQDFEVASTPSVGTTGTITLNDIPYAIVLTAGSTANMAEEIAQSITAQAGSLWHAYATTTSVMPTVKFIKKGVGAVTGAFSYTPGDTDTGAFTQKVVGQAVTDEWVAQADWSENSADWLVPGSGNVYAIDYQWLGFGDIRFSLENPETGELELVHRIKYANNHAWPSVANGSMKAEMTAASLGSTTAMDVYGASMGIFTYGESKVLTTPRGFGNTRTAVATGSGLVNLLTVRNRIAFNNVFNQGEIIPKLLTISTDSTKGAEIDLYLDPDIGGDQPNFVFVDESTSIAETDIIGQTVPSGGTLLASFALGPNGSEIISLDEIAPEILYGQRLVVAGKINSGAAADISAALNWRESV